MKKILLLISLTFALSACVSQPPRITNTTSGKPEVTIATNDVARVRAELVGDAVNYGYTIEQDTPYSLAMSRVLNGQEQLMASTFVGNGYSSNRRILTYTIVPSEGFVRVVASCSIRAQMPGGQVNIAPIDSNNAVFNVYQESLEKMKQKIESTGVIASKQ